MLVVPAGTMPVSKLLHYLSFLYSLIFRARSIWSTLTSGCLSVYLQHDYNRISLWPVVGELVCICQVRNTAWHLVILVISTNKYSFLLSSYNSLLLSVRWHKDLVLMFPSTLWGPFTQSLLLFCVQGFLTRLIFLSEFSA